MGWIEDILDGAWDFIFGTDLDALQGIYDFIINLPASIADMFGALMMLVAYPFVVVINVLYQLMALIYTKIATSVNMVIQIPNAYIALVGQFQTHQFPSAWTMIWLTMLLITGYLMIYKKLRGVQILGFKIP